MEESRAAGEKRKQLQSQQRELNPAGLHILIGEVNRVFSMPCFIEWSNGTRSESTLSKAFGDDSNYREYKERKEAGEPYPVKVTVIDPAESGEKGKTYDAIRANREYNFNALETEIEARKAQKTDRAINSSFLKYSLAELMEAAELEADLQTAKAISKTLIAALNRYLKGSETA